MDGLSSQTYILIPHEPIGEFEPQLSWAGATLLTLEPPVLTSRAHMSKVPWCVHVLPDLRFTANVTVPKLYSPLRKHQERLLNNHARDPPIPRAFIPVLCHR